MSDSQLKDLWKSTNDKLEKTISTQTIDRADISNLKILNLLSTMKPVKLFTLIVGILWVLIGSIIIYNLFANAYDKVSPFFLYSASMQIVLTSVAIIIYIYQLVIINTTDISMPVIETQKKISGLRLSTLWSAKVLFLQLPLWTTFYLSSDTIISGDLTYILINGLIVALFTCAAVWLFTNIKFENRNKKWFKLIFEGKEWTPLMQSMVILSEINDYEVKN